MNSNSAVISLDDPSLDRSSRKNYLDSLESAILNLPITLPTKKLLSVKIPFEEKIGQYGEKTLLYAILDKGVIWEGVGEVPSSWTNDVGLWNDPSLENEGEETKVQKYLLSQHIQADDFEHSFGEVNEYLKGFSFRFADVGHQWLFYFNSDAFNDSIRRQLAEHGIPSE